MKFSRSAAILSALFALAPASRAYDPLALPKEAPGKSADFTVTDTVRKRDIPLRVYLPAENKPAPVVLFSHGLGGSRENNPYLGRHWAARGYVAVFLQHPGSDDSVWKDKPAAQRMSAMQAAASGQNFLLRVDDVKAALNQLAKWNATEGHALAGRMDLKKVGMSGHSFGAQTTQAVSGQRFPVGASPTDERIRAAIAFSPNAPQRGDSKDAFGAVKIPWLLMTGTKDLGVIGGATVETRLAVFPALAPGDKYELVLHDAEHSAFGDRALPGESGQRNPNHHRVILALSTAFWDAHLRGDETAKSWLNGAAPRTVMEEKDRWQKK